MMLLLARLVVMPLSLALRLHQGTDKEALIDWISPTGLVEVGAANLTYVPDGEPSALQALQLTREKDSCMMPSMMQARGFSRVCCNVYVTCYNNADWRVMNGHESARNWEYRADLHRLPPRPDYGAMLPQLSKPGVKVYVPSMNMLDFLDAFVKLPSNASVTVVTGQEDVGVPRELWGDGRPFMGKRKPTSLGYQEFIADPRLKHWFVQNYDLTGCPNPHDVTDNYGCSPIKDDDPLTQKVTPIPIGLPFYQLSEMEKGSGKRSVAIQHLELMEMLRSATPFQNKTANKLFMPFHPRERDNMTQHRIPEGRVHHWMGRRKTMWWWISTTYMFVASPPGHGMDTYRVWETLALGSIPVVRSSSLDRLYRQFPIIIVPSWSSMNARSFQKWKDEIISRFGQDPFNSTMKQKLQMKYWVDLVRETANPAARSSSSACLPPDAGDLKKEWGCLPHYANNAKPSVE